MLGKQNNETSISCSEKKYKNKKKEIPPFVSKKRHTRKGNVRRVKH